MSRMTRSQRIASYRKILAESPSLEMAVNEILANLNSLVWIKTRKPFSKEEKIKLLEEIFEGSDLEKSLPGLESFEWIGRSTGAINEADNSHILDVISALKRGVKD